MSPPASLQQPVGDGLLVTMHEHGGHSPLRRLRYVQGWIPLCRRHFSELIFSQLVFHQEEPALFLTELTVHAHVWFPF